MHIIWHGSLPSGASIKWHKYDVKEALPSLMPNFQQSEISPGKNVASNIRPRLRSSLIHLPSNTAWHYCQRRAIYYRYMAYHALVFNIKGYALRVCR